MITPHQPTKTCSNVLLNLSTNWKHTKARIVIIHLQHQTMPPIIIQSSSCITFNKTNPSEWCRWRNWWLNLAIPLCKLRSLYHGFLCISDWYHRRGSTRGGKSSFVFLRIPRRITNSPVGGRRDERIQFRPEASDIFLRKLFEASRDPLYMVPSVSKGVVRPFGRSLWWVWSRQVCLIKSQVHRLQPWCFNSHPVAFHDTDEP